MKSPATISPQRNMTMIPADIIPRIHQIALVLRRASGLGWMAVWVGWVAMNHLSSKSNQYTSYERVMFRLKMARPIELSLCGVSKKQLLRPGASRDVRYR